MAAFDQDQDHLFESDQILVFWCGPKEDGFESVLQIVVYGNRTAFL